MILNCSLKIANYFMKILNLIEKTRGKSEEERKMIAVGVTVGLMLIIIFVWLSTFDLSVSTVKDGQTASVAPAEKAELSPSASIKNIFSEITDTIKSVKDGIGKVKEEVAK